MCFVDETEYGAYKAYGDNMNEMSVIKGTHISNGSNFGSIFIG